MVAETEELKKIIETSKSYFATNRDGSVLEEMCSGLSLEGVGVLERAYILAEVTGRSIIL
ncbi:hypothetical protein ACFL2V_15010 [Pseudomonadota bacterium]